MRLIRTKVEAEISATSYKKLVQALKPLSKKELWKILDHYIFHVIEDKHVNELLLHLKEFEEQNIPITAAFEDEDSPSLKHKPETYRPKFEDTVTEEILGANQFRLDLMFDPSYFENYLATPEARESVAKKLINYCTANALPVQEYWKDYISEETEN